MEDHKIIELYFSRDEKAIELTDEKYGHYCYSIANNILANEEDSEECVSDTWLRTWNAIPPARPFYFKLFLAKITRGLSFDRIRLRKAKKRGQGEIDLVLDELAECIPCETQVEDQILAKELGDVVNAYLKTLPEKECDVFLRRYFYVESVKDIAAMYGMTSGNVSVMLNRTRSKLKGYLEKEGLL